MPETRADLCLKATTSNASPSRTAAGAQLATAALRTAPSRSTRKTRRAATKGPRYFISALAESVSLLSDRTRIAVLQLCIEGECKGSICLEWNMTECFLTSQHSPNIDKRRLCMLACQNGTDTATCRSTSEFAEKVGLPPGGISLRPGSPCDNFQVSLTCQ